MDYKKIEKQAYTLHLINTNKFKSILVKVMFHKKITKKEITLRNMLVDNLIYSCSKYPTKKEMAIKKQDLYGVDISGYNKRIANKIITEITMSLLNPKYTEDAMLEESLSFLSEIIFNPNVDNGCFNKEIFINQKENTISEIKSIKDRPSSYAFTKLKEHMDSNSYISYNINGYLSDALDIDCEKLYQYYLEFLKDNMIDIYVVGNIEDTNIEELIDKYFKFSSSPLKEAFVGNNLSKRANVKQIKEPSSFNQSFLAIGCNILELDKKEDYYTLILYNIILGNSPDSKFFKDIREKNSMCYSINSNFKKLDDVMFISAGISSKNMSEVIELIKKNMKEMEEGNFTLADIEKAKEAYISVLNDIYEYEDSILDYVFSCDYLEQENIDKQINIIKQITKEDIINVSSKIKFNTIYLLEEKDGGNDEGD